MSLFSSYLDTICHYPLQSGFIQKVESQIQEHSRTFLGGKQICSRTFPARHPHILFTIVNTINRAISSRETKSLTEVGAVKHVNNGYYRKNRHSVLLRGMLFNQEMNVQR